MIRIIAGELKGRRIRAPAGRRARPTADRVREAWFSILEPWLAGALVLDLFAGSGALGLEALSRGALHVDFVETSRASLRVLEANVASLAVEDRVTVHRADALRFAARLPEASYDVALADPPYDTDHAVGLTGIFRARPFAKILAVEHRSGVEVPGDDIRRYGDIAITFCKAP